MEELVAGLKEAVMRSADISRELPDDLLYKNIDKAILDAGRERMLTLSERTELRRRLYAAIRGLDVIQDLVDDCEITEIMINGPEDIFIEKHGRIARCPCRFSSPEKLEDVIQHIVSGVNRVVNEASPIVDARLSDGSRVHVVLPPIALNGPVVTIRKFPSSPITMKQLVEWGAITYEAAEFLKLLVRSGYNIFISGGTGSGKTTFLNALSGFIPEDERVITIEDSAELQLSGIPDLVRLEARNASLQGSGQVSIRDLIRASLRMRPNRIIVGEVRSGEALDMLSAMNTGHDGSLSTGHGNSPADMMNRLEMMALMGADLPLEAIRGQIGSAIDILIHLGRLRDRSRRVLSITEVIGYENGKVNMRPLYEFKESGEEENGRVRGELKATGDKLENTQKAEAAGLWKRGQERLPKNGQNTG